MISHLYNTPAISCMYYIVTLLQVFDLIMSMTIKYTLLLLILKVELHYILGLYYSGYSNVIYVNANGNNTTACCVEGNCSCSSLAKALQNIRKDNTVIIISSSRIVLFASANISGRTSIGIMGNNNTVVDCNDTGVGVFLLYCKDIYISGITWNQCGESKSLSAISIMDSFNVAINNCTFKNSSQFGINISATLGYINVTNSVFINNSRLSHRGAGGMVILPLQQYLNTSASIVFIINCSFLYNGFRSSTYGGGVSITKTNSSSLYILVANSQFIANSAFDQNGGALYVHAKTRKFVLQIFNVTFKDNNKYALFCQTEGIKETDITFNITNSNITSNMYIKSDHSEDTFMFVKDTIFESADGNLAVNLEFIVSCLLVNLSNSTLLGAQIKLYVKSYQDGLYIGQRVIWFDNLSTDTSSIQVDGSESYGLQCYLTGCLFVNHSYNSSVVDIVNPGYYNNAVINITNCAFIGNSEGISVVHLAYLCDECGCNGAVRLSNVNFSQNFDNENTLYVSNSKLSIDGLVVFQNNAAIKGAAIYFTECSFAVLADNAKIEFIGNVAALGGGAIYADYPPSFSPWLLFYTLGKYFVKFKNNYANSAGNSIYFNIPGGSNIETNASSEKSIMFIPREFTYSGSDYKEQISTSPYTISLGIPAVVNKTSEFSWTFTVKNIMLGEVFLNMAKVIDYFNNSAEEVLFHVECLDCMRYKINGINSSFIYVGSSQSISIVGKEIESDFILLELQLYSIKGTVTSDAPNIHIKIELFLSRCKLGYEYYNTTDTCMCLTFYDTVLCSKNGVKIKKGYWLGTVHTKKVVGICPKSYCSYNSCPINSEFCNVTFSNSICAAHRDGPACGKCKKYYTLPFDSTSCIHSKNCHVWQSLLVVALTMLYWITTILAVRLVMYYVKIEAITGYVYGVIFFYSILDLLIDESLNVSEGLKEFVSVLSSIFNLSPIFIGKLCLSDKIEGIDQQFIHYIHPLAIIVLLLIIAGLANRSVRVTAILGRVGIIRSICLLLLLFYTSLSSTSWELLRPLTFNGDSGVYTYSSPNIYYFSGRHVVYSIVAVLCVVIIVIGLPALLLLEPFLRRKFTFIKWKPLLDQFQGCYKNKYHCFAANYLICRQMIFAILSLDTMRPTDRYLLLQLLCLLILMVHVWVQPYKDTCLNSLDTSTLLCMMIIVSLNIEIESTTLYGNMWGSDLVVGILVLFPLMTFIVYLLYSSCFCGSTLFQRSRRGYVTLQRSVHKWNLS